MGRAISLALAMMLIGCAAAPSRQFVVFFGTNDDRLTPEAREIVAQVAATARGQQATKVAVAGYGDGEGDAAQDAALAERRSAKVVQALTDAGVDARTIQKRPGVPPAAATGIPVHKVTVTLDPP
jgi:outer membrane protein OmpA-like peptidoglycan-associated protein